MMPSQNIRQHRRYTCNEGNRGVLVWGFRMMTPKNFLTRKYFAHIITFYQYEILEEQGFSKALNSNRISDEH